VQQAALLELVVGDVLVFVIEDVVAGQQRVAVIGLGAYGVAAIAVVHAQRGAQRFVLGMQDVLALVAPLHFLKKQQVGMQAIQAQAQLRQRFARADRRSALVDVVADDAQDRHGRPPGLIWPRSNAAGYAALATVSRRPEKVRA